MHDVDKPSIIGHCQKLGQASLCHWNQELPRFPSMFRPGGSYDRGDLLSPHICCQSPLFDREGDGMRASLLHVDKDPDDQSCRAAEPEEEGECHPGIVGSVNDRRANIGSDERGDSVGDTEETEEHWKARQRAKGVRSEAATYCLHIPAE